MDNEDVKNLIQTNLDLAKLTEKLTEKIRNFELDIDELKRTGVKPKKKKLRNTIGLKVIDGGRPLEEQPPFAN